MAKTKVRQDEHGLYIRTNGSVYRPEKSKWSHTTVYNLKHGFVTTYTVGQEVRVNALSGSPLATIRTDERCEMWHTHGSYLKIDGESTWNPG